MKIADAVAYVTDILTKNPKGLLNGIMNGALGTSAEGDENRVALEPLLEVLAESPEYREFNTELTNNFRHMYRAHNCSLEALVFATYIGGFIAGVQFHINGGTAPDPRLDPLTPPTPPPKTLVN